MAIQKNVSRNPVNQGFTLVELSIVILIIGLIAGGIIIGKDLIRNAEIRAQVTQLEKYNSALNTFRNKYACLPGDCIGSTFGFTGNGNNNSRIEVPIDGGGHMDDPEQSRFWVHLSQAQLIDGRFVFGFVPGTNSPPLAFPGMGRAGNHRGGLWLVPFAPRYQAGANYANAWFLTTTSGQATNGVYLPADAYLLDKKADDGLPLDGGMRASGNSIYFAVCNMSTEECVGALNNTVSDYGAGACVDDSNPAETAQYNVKVTAITNKSLCAPVVSIAF